jgi:hypothetical protein
VASKRKHGWHAPPFFHAGTAPVPSSSLSPPHPAPRFGTEHEKLGYYLDTKERLSVSRLAE